jgi:hypothetical protein
LAMENVRIRSTGDSTDYCFTDFDGGSWHETCGSKICSVAPVTRAVGLLCWSFTGLLETTNKDLDFLRKGHGSMAMTLKQKLSLPNGSRLSLHIHRQHGQVRAMSRPCWRFFKSWKCCPA